MLGAMGLVADLARLAQRVTRRSGTAWDDAGLRREIGLVAADLDALWALTKRNVTQAGRGALSIAGGSAFKLTYADVRHRLGDLAMRILDRASLSLEDLPVDATGSTGAGGRPARTGAQVHSDLHALAVGIAAGTSQIQRNILAEKVLGLPREPR
jgi:alkylation response protein AidB-like acyl-CoA dehydrogenase